MNGGLEIQSRDLKRRQLLPTQFFIGAVTTNYKMDERSVVPQYLKLEKKIQHGAQFIINQIGYDARKMHEQIIYLQQHNLGHIPLIGNVFVLNAHVSRLFHSQRIPGVVVSDELLAVCEKQASSFDNGKGFFLELAAKQMAIYRGLGYRGAYLGGVHRWEDLAQIFAMADRFSDGDWKSFVRELRFSRPGEFFLYPKDCQTGLSKPVQQQTSDHRFLKFSTACHYRFSKWIHDFAFMRGKRLALLAEWFCGRFTKYLPAALHMVERMSKSVLFDCRDCGDCSLHEIAFLCPESQCVKNQRNGPCGGSRDLLCEVRDVECIWSQAYVRRKRDGKEHDLLNHVPVLQDHALRGTSSWVNAWLGRDHSAQSMRANNHQCRS
jgi:methylenetetrahydrofolate reductase (NADPH)